MKLRNHIALLLAALLPLAAGAQELVYDFSAGKYKKNNMILSNGKLAAVRSGGFATIRIINVNTFRFNVSIQGNSIQYVTQMPSELQTLFRVAGKETNKNTEEGSKDINTALDIMKNKAGETVRRVDQKDIRLAKVFEDKRRTHNTYDSLSQFVVPLSPIKLVDKKRNEAFMAAKAVADAAEKAAEAAQIEAAKIEAFAEAMKELVAACEEYIEMAGKIALIKLRKIELINLCRQDWESHSKMAEQLPEPMSREDMQISFKKFSEYYAEASALYAAAYLAAVNDNDRKTVNDAQELLKAGHKKISEDDLLKLIEDVDMLQTALENPKTFTVVSPPIHVDGDFVAFEVSATPARAIDLMNHLPAKSFKVEMPVQGGMKVDFSVGPAISIGKKAKNDLYYTEPAGLDDTKDDSVVFRQRNNNNAISPGIAAMVHIYRRTGRNFSIGGMFGIGAGFKDSAKIDFSLYAGPTLVLGKREKVMLSAGVSFLRVSRLKDREFVPGKIYPVAKIDIPAITEKVYKSSFFIALSYNLTTRQDIR